MTSPAAEAFLARLPSDLSNDLSDDQKQVLCGAVEQAWRKHSVDLRLSVPMFGARYYLTLVAGKDNRCPIRTAKNKEHYPFKTVGNVLFFLGIASLFYFAAILMVAMQSSIIEF